jgi:hypothetical protein
LKVAHDIHLLLSAFMKAVTTEVKLSEMAERSPAFLPKPNVLQWTDQPQLLPVSRFTLYAAGTNTSEIGIVAALLAGNVIATSGQANAVSIQASPTTG